MGRPGGRPRIGCPSAHTPDRRPRDRRSPVVSPRVCWSRDRHGSTPGCPRFRRTPSRPSPCCSRSSGPSRRCRIRTPRRDRHVGRNSPTRRHGVSNHRHSFHGSAERWIPTCSRRFAGLGCRTDGGLGCQRSQRHQRRSAAPRPHRSQPLAASRARLRSVSRTPAPRSFRRCWCSPAGSLAKYRHHHEREARWRHRLRDRSRWPSR